MKDRRSERVIAVDLDGTLAVKIKWDGSHRIGEPVPMMLARVKRWLEQGIDVRIFTARAFEEVAIRPIDEWCLQHLGRTLTVTNVKAPEVTEFWDDRCVQVQRDTGKVTSRVPLDALSDLDPFVHEGEGK